MKRLATLERRSAAKVEPLEGRRLMSAGTWSNVYSDPNGQMQAGMAADKFGNVYAISIVNGGSTLVKETGGQWTTVSWQGTGTPEWQRLAID